MPALSAATSSSWPAIAPAPIPAPSSSARAPLPRTRTCAASQSTVPIDSATMSWSPAIANQPSSTSSTGQLRQTKGCARNCVDIVTPIVAAHGSIVANGSRHAGDASHAAVLPTLARRAIGRFLAASGAGGAAYPRRAPGE
jgi:hypothetical protein